MEHTRLFQDEGGKEMPLQAQETHMARIVRTAESLYESADQPRVTAKVHFTPDPYLSSDNASALARNLANTVAKNVPEPSSHVKLTQRDSPDALSSQFRAVQIYRFAESAHSLWSAPPAVWTPLLERSELEKRLLGSLPTLIHPARVVIGFGY